MQIILLFLLIACTVLPVSLVPPKSTVTHDYCIVGAGPAGLQFGYFLKKAQHDFVIFEKADTVGSFFLKYPRHRQLISINKRFTGRSNREFNLRHDWNSLLSDDDSLLFTKYSENYFPHADEYLQYLDDYRTKLDIPVQFNTHISNITQSAKKECKFEMQDQNDNNYCCKRVLVIANGISEPITSSGEGHDAIEGYEDFSVDPKTFDGQAVLIFGRGNGAFETAKSLYGHAAYITLAARSRIRFSWDTHYVGDIRGVNNEVLDSYQLKSLDGVLEGLSLDSVNIVRRGDGKLDLSPAKGSYINLEDLDTNPARHGYDRILRCIGFHWDKSLFHPSTTPSMSNSTNGKYPLIDDDYQSKDFPGMYFIGTLAHSLDWRKAAGGFIHGFRYTARALHRILEWTVHKGPWSASRYKLVDEMPNTFLKRANEASGIYQMFGHLGDFAVYDRTMQAFLYLEEVPVNLWNRFWEMTGFQFSPGRHLLFIMTMEYGANFSKPGHDHFGPRRVQGSYDSAELSNFLHPVIRVFKDVPEKTADVRLHSIFKLKPFGIHHILEDFTTEFSAVKSHINPFRKFIEFFTETDLSPYSADFCAEAMLITHVYDAHSPGTIKLPHACQRLLEREESVSLYDLEETF